MVAAFCFFVSLSYFVLMVFAYLALTLRLSLTFRA